MSTKVKPGLYVDAFEPRGPVEVIGEGYSLRHNARFIIIRVPGDTLYDLIPPDEFYMTVTVKVPENQTAKVMRFIPAVLES